MATDRFGGTILDDAPTDRFGGTLLDAPDPNAPMWERKPVRIAQKINADIAEYQQGMSELDDAYYRRDERASLADFMQPQAPDGPPDFSGLSGDELVGAQVQERIGRARADMQAEAEAERQQLGLSPEDYRLYKQAQQEQYGDPFTRLLNAPIFRGVLQGAQDAGGGLVAEPLLRLTGQGDKADELAQTRVERQRIGGMVANQQGKAAQYADQLAQMTTAYMPAIASGVPAPFVVGLSSYSDALAESAGTDASTASRQAHAITRSVVDGLLTYAGGKLGGGTFEEMLGGRIPAKNASEFVRSYAAELGEEYGQQYSQSIVNALYGIGNTENPTPEQLVDTLAVVTLGQGFGAALNMGNEAPPKVKAARDFVDNPSRSNAKKAGVDKFYTDKFAREDLARRVRERVAEFEAEQRRSTAVVPYDQPSTDIVPQTQGEPNEGIVQAEGREEGRQGEVEPDATVPSGQAAAFIAMPPFDTDDVVAAGHKIYRWMKKNFLSGGEQNEATRDLNFRREGIVRKHAAGVGQNIRDLKRAVRKAYRVASLKQIPDNVSQELDQALKDPQRLARLAQTKPDVAVEIQKLRDHIDGLSATVASLPDVSAELQMTIGQNLGVYVTRTYRKFEDAEGWRRHALKDPTIMADFAAEVRQSSPNATQQEIEQLADILLRRDTMDLGDMVGPTPRTTSYVNVLKRRKNLSQAVRNLYGENKDVFTNYQQSVEKMASLVANRLFVDELKKAGMAAGFMSDMGNLQPGHVQEVNHKQIPQLRGLQGVLMPEDVADSINEIFKANIPGKLERGYLAPMGWSKAMKTVGAVPRAFVRNFFGNLPIALANGVDLATLATRPTAKAAKDLFVNDVLNKSTPAAKARMQRYAELGLIEGTTVEALRDIAKRSATSMAQYLGGVNSANLFRSFTRSVASTYQAMDVVWKLATFENYLPQYRQAYPNLSQDELEVMVARIVRDVTPTYSAASKAARFWSRYVPFGPFAMFSAEMLRTSANRWRLTYQEATSGNPALQKLAAKRVAGNAAMAAAAYAAVQIAKEALGIGDDEMEAVRQRVAPWQRNSVLMPTGRDKDGNIIYVDLGYNDPLSVFTNPMVALSRGDVEGAVGEVAEPFVGEDLFWGAWLSALRNKQVSGKPVYDTGLPEDEQNKQLIMHIVNTMEPGTIDIMQRIAQAAKGEKTPGGKTRDLSNEVLSAIGGTRIETLDRANSDFFNNRRFNQQIKDSEASIRKLFFAEPWNPEEVERLYLATESERKSRMQKWREYIDGSVLLGETNPYGKVVEDIGAQSTLIKLVYAKAYVPYQFRKQDFGKMLKLSNGQERIELYSRLMGELLATPVAQ